MNPKIRCLIVDDELLAREGLRSLATRDGDLQIIGDCANGTQAIEFVLEHRPDLLFLDIQMPEMDGFAVLNELRQEILPYIIFVTAYDQYAVRAFDVHALDYLLKPVDEDRFDLAIERAKEVLRSKADWTTQITAFLREIGSQQHRYLDRVVVKEEGRIFFIKTVEIDWIEAKGNYALIHSGKKRHLIREAMSSLEEQLNPFRFFRIHRSTIVNADRIQEMQPLFHGDCRVILQDGTTLLMSRRFRDKLRNHLSI